jgi:hypothetical protein
MPKHFDEKATIMDEIGLEGCIEELESIVAPGIATSPGPVPNHR